MARVRPAAVSATIQSTSARANHAPPRSVRAARTVGVSNVGERQREREQPEHECEAGAERAQFPSLPSSTRQPPRLCVAQDRSGEFREPPRALFRPEAQRVDGRGATRGPRLDEPEHVVLVRGEVGTASSNVHAQHEPLRTDFFESDHPARGEVDDGRGDGRRGDVPRVHKHVNDRWWFRTQLGRLRTRAWQPRHPLEPPHQKEEQPDRRRDASRDERRQRGAVEAVVRRHGSEDRGAHKRSATARASAVPWSCVTPLPAAR